MKRATVEALAAYIFHVVIGEQRAKYRGAEGRAVEFCIQSKSVKAFYRKVARAAIEHHERYGVPT